MNKFILISIFISFNIYGQSFNKCGIIQKNEPFFLRNNQNWGYVYDSLLVDLDRWNNSSFVTIDSIGASVQNRAIWELTIANDPESNLLQRVYIHARTHPGEEESFWVTNEIINILISDSPLADFMRANCIFHIIPMVNPDGVELGYARENANGIDIESGWDDSIPEPEVAVLKNRFIELMAADNPVEVALNMHSAYPCRRYFVYHAAQGTSYQYTLLEQQFINGVRSYFPNGFEPWDYFVSWTSGTPPQYPESWWWMNHGGNVMALTYEDMNCQEAGSYDSTANALVQGVVDYLGLDYSGIVDENGHPPAKFILRRNYPNPFNPKTNIHFRLLENTHVNLIVYDLMGNHIRTLVSSPQKRGEISIQWDGKNEKGEMVPAGIYFYAVNSGNFRQSRKMILLK